MLRVGRYIFKRADTSREFEQIHRLNYRTFVEEIPQHPDSGAGLLVDKFHDKNVYFIAVREERVVGMVSVHGQPPFSVASRLSNPGVLQRPGSRPLEVRLLAVEPSERNGIVVTGMLWMFYQHARAQGFTELYISGVSDRIELYRRLGFEAIGPAVGDGDACFVPMSAGVSVMEAKLKKLEGLWVRRVQRVNEHSEASRGHQPPEETRNACTFSPGADAPGSPNVCLLPGPVTVAPAVRDAFHAPPIYHRGPEFIAQFERTRRTLGNLVNGRDVALLNGSGTLGNETVAAALAAEIPDGPRPRGVLLVNGEFGERLARQAVRFGLNPRVLSWPWGKPWDLAEVQTALDEEPPGSWIWGVHLESSTGVLNDLPGLVRAARPRGIRVCIDCISSLGAVPIDLRGVFLATAATGKSLGAYAGMAIVIADARSLPRSDLRRLPSYFDLAAALATEGPRFTFPSPVLHAVQAALAEYATPELAQARYQRYAELGALVRRQLHELGLPPLAEEANACPVVTTFVPPGEETSRDFVARCQSWGFAIGGQSGYLAERRLVQIATMGAVGRAEVEGLFASLGRWLSNCFATLV